MKTGISTKNPFRTCLPSPEGHSSGWVSLSSLYDLPNEHDSRKSDVNGHVSALERGVGSLNTPNQLLFVARTGLRYQIFDTKLWNDIYHHVINMRDYFKPRQWVEVVHIFKRMKVRKPGLMDLATKELLYQLERLPLEDLSKLALSFAYHQYCPSVLFARIAEVVTTRLRRQNMQSLPKEALEKEEEETVKAHPLAKITSYTHLLGAFAKCNHPHKEMFEAVAGDLLLHINAKEMLIPPGFLVKIFVSYASLGYRHNTLFDALCKEMVTAKLSDEELLQLQAMMKSLDYENDIMLNVFAYRLGNSYISRTSQRALISQ